MSIITVEGFKVYFEINGKKSIIINSDCIDQCMRLYTEHHFDGVAITTSHDYKLQNVDFLFGYTEIKNLTISDGIDNINAIHTLHNLEFLCISGKKRKVDFSHFPSLTQLIADWSPHFLNLDKCVYLDRLSFYNYAPKIKDCSDIPNIPTITKLKIVQSPIKALIGLGNFNRLEEIELIYCSKLEKLCCLEESKETLVSLRFDHCKSIQNHDYVIRLDHLNTLAFIDSGTMPSIEFIKEMVSLKDFMFSGTDVIDG